MFEKKILGSRLRSLRQAKKLKQADVAAYLGVTKTQISDIENGKVATSLEKIYILADYFDTSMDYIAGRSDEISQYKPPLNGAEPCNVLCTPDIDTLYNLLRGIVKKDGDASFEDMDAWKGFIKAFCILLGEHREILDGAYVRADRKND